MGCQYMVLDPTATQTFCNCSKDSKVPPGNETTVTGRTAMTPLKGKQRRYLRALGHALDPVVRVGKDGITDGLVNAVSATLTDHELVKVKLLEEAPEDRKEASRQLAQRCEAHEIQIIGRSILLFRPHPTDPRIVVPT